MANKKKIYLGFVFIVISLVAFMAAFYVLEIEPELAKVHKKNSLIEKINPRKNLSSNLPSKISGEIEEKEKVSLTIKSLVEEAQSIYSEEEKSKKEGFLWFDSKTGKTIVTLGAIHGLKNGKYLTVYKGERKIGRVFVDISYDVISYVTPLNNTKDLIKEGYFRVVVE